MCDTLVALPPATGSGNVVFGKNSDRERDEAQLIELYPAAAHPPGARLPVTRITIAQVPRTRAVLIARPYWMWGAEMGANEAGVVIGNEAVHSIHPPDRAPGLLGMDLLRLGLERAGSAAEARDVITSLLKEHGQGGDCGHRHAHFYHNSFIIADTTQAFVLETVGRDWESEPVQGIRTISNAYTLPAMRTHADAELEAPGAGQARCARTSALLAQSAGRIGVQTAMATLRDHGPESCPEAGPQARTAIGTPWHPQDTVGRTVCMHAGAGERRGQSVGSMVSELRPDGAIHWLTGTSAPCTSLFKPVTFESGLPAPRDLWPHHERLHRALLRDARFLPDWFLAERDALEADFVRRTRQLADAAVVASCWADALAAEAQWAERIGVPPETVGAAFAASWR